MDGVGKTSIARHMSKQASFASQLLQMMVESVVGVVCTAVGVQLYAISEA